MSAPSFSVFDQHNVSSSLITSIPSHILHVRHYYPRLVLSSHLLEVADQQIPLTIQPKCMRRRKRRVYVPIEQNRFWLKQFDSKAYPEALVQPNAGKCRMMHDWQKMAGASISTCQDLHLWDLSDLLPTDAETMLLGTGTWRHAFNVRDYDGNRFALKMLRASDGMHGEGWFSPRNYEGARRDAIMNERLTTPNPSHVLQTFGHCGISGVFELADGGVLKNLLWYQDEDGEEYEAHWTMLDRLKIGTQIAIGLKEVHAVGGDNTPSFSTCDLQIDQIMNVNGSWRVSDFNRGEFLQIDHKGKPCPYTQQFNAGNDVTRSPEEFWIDNSLTSAVDVYHLGSILYALLTSMQPYGEYLEGKEIEDHWHIKFDIVHERISLGAMPRMPEYFLKRRNPATQALIEAIKMCLRFTPALRATASQVADYLSGKLEEIERRLVGDPAHRHSRDFAPPRIVFYTSGGSAYRLNPRHWPVSDELVMSMSMHGDAHDHQDAEPIDLLSGTLTTPSCRAPCNELHQGTY